MNMKRTEIQNLKAGKKVCIHAWVDTIRDKKAIQFIVLRDRSGKVQMTVHKEKLPEVARIFETILTDSTVIVHGKVMANPSVIMGGMEIIPTHVELTSSAAVMPIDENSAVDLRMDYRFLDLRDRKKLLVFQIQTITLKAIRDWFVKKNFVEIMTPKITGAGAEGGSEVFEVKYFERKAYLTQSPQLFKQMGIAAGFEKVFEIGANYRAEKSHTSRHATEFFALDVEMGFINDEHDIMDVEEEMLRYVFTVVAKECSEKLTELGVELIVPKTKFPRITLLEAYDLLEKERGYIVPKASKGDLDPEAERLLCEISKEKFGSEFIFITEYPSSARVFYIMRKPQIDKNGPLVTRGFDLLYKGVELTSGGQREHNPETLRQNMRLKGMNESDLEFYINFFEYGCPPHGGFALGIARLVARMLDLPSVKDATFLFRGPDRLEP